LVSDYRYRYRALVRAATRSRHKDDRHPSASGKGQDTTPAISSGPRVNSILWVDDNPKNNSFLVERLSKLGIQVTQVLSTAEAISLLSSMSFDRIISDMG
jgi:PleD family two-component response regulator